MLTVAIGCKSTRQIEAGRAAGDEIEHTRTGNPPTS
jgi:hypothetical protein